MFDKEREMVELGPRSYNLKEGGRGGFTSEMAKRGRLKTDDILMEKYGSEWCSILGKRGAIASQTESTSVIRKETAQRGHDEGWFSWKGKNHSDQTKQVMSEKAKIRLAKENYHSGTMWITNETENRKIKKESIVPEGWKKGRFLKNI
jgi:hypothetical protein